MQNTAEGVYISISTVITTVTKIAHTPLRTLAVRRSLRSYLVSKSKFTLYGFYMFIPFPFVYVPENNLKRRSNYCEKLKKV